MTVEEAVKKRHSTRYYDSNKKIHQSDLETILNAGIMAPNGIGIEPWFFYVLDGDKKYLRSICKNQEHIETSSHVIALVNFKKEYVENNLKSIEDKLITNGASGDRLEMYMSWIKVMPTQYYREQTMFAAGQMALQAAGLGIGSVIVGGFEPEAVAELIKLDTYNYEVALLMTLGYSTEPIPTVRTKRRFDEVVKRITL